MPQAQRYGFGSFELDTRSRRLLKDGSPVALSSRHFDLLLMLVAQAGALLTKDQLIAAAWPDVAVTDNSLEQAISSLRRTLGTSPDHTFIETQARRGYRFSAAVTPLASRESDEALDAMLAPHRAWLEGRAALETLERDQVLHASAVFADVVRQMPGAAPAHVGLANACVLQFEMTRSDDAPDTNALEAALTHAREACRLDSGYGEAWATLGFVLDRAGRHDDAIAASRRAIGLEPDNWRHHFRLAYVGWGDERLRGARRALTLLPGFALAHWLNATVHVARGAFDDALREIEAGQEGRDRQEGQEGREGQQRRFSSIALDWLHGLILLARDEHDAALRAFERELASEGSGHLYARECCANTWYAIGALRLRAGQSDEARGAFGEAIRRMPRHVPAHLGRAAAGGAPPAFAAPSTIASHGVDGALAHAVQQSLSGDRQGAAATLDAALAQSPPGGAGWLLPLEPLLHVQRDPDVWSPVLTRLRMRSA